MLRFYSRIKSTFIFLILLCYAQVLQSCLILRPVDHSPPGSSVRLLMGISRQEYWSRLLCPPPGDLPNPEIKPISSNYCITGRSLIHWTTWEAHFWYYLKAFFPLVHFFVPDFFNDMSNFLPIKYDIFIQAYFSLNYLVFTVEMFYQV